MHSQLKQNLAKYYILPNKFHTSLIFQLILKKNIKPLQSSKDIDFVESF